MSNWPTREEWAKERRAAYYDDPDYPRASRQASLYATADELVDTHGTLRVIWSAYGKRMRELKHEAWLLHCQAGESELSYWKRVRDFPEADKATEIEVLRSKRRHIKEAVAALEANMIPSYHTGHPGAEAEAYLAFLKERYEAGA